MLKNYFRIAWRHLTKNKGYTFINIAGLATGMAIAVIIGIWITDESTYDNYHKNHSQIAVGMVKQSANGQAYAGNSVTVPLGGAMRAQYSDLFTKTALAHGGWGHLVASGEKKIQVDGFWAQPEITDIFTFEMTKGTASSYSDPSTALIAESLAKGLFGDENPIGKPLKINNSIEFKVGGVYKDQPENSSFGHVKIWMPYNNKENNYYLTNTNWDDHNGQLFVLLAKNIRAEQATARIKDIPTSHIKGWHEEAFVWPLDKAHLYNDFSNGVPSGGRIQFVWLFGIIGVFILLLACINFMNLSTARSEKRAREVGIRKTVGSLKNQLVLQFLIESILVATLAFVVALGIITLALPYFNQLAAKTMELPYNKGLFWALTAGFVLFTGLLAGSYPAFYLSGFNPVKVLKGTFRVGRFASLPRKILVVLQFTVSLTLIIGTIIVYRQIEHASDRPVGYSRDGLVGVWLSTPEIKKNYEIIRQELIQKGIAANVAASSQSILNFDNNNGLDWRGKRPDQESVFFKNVNVTHDFGQTIGWKVLQGRDFSRDFATDSNSIILNDTAAKTIGITNPVGERVKFGGKNYTIIGVVNNLVTNSPYEPVDPAIFIGDGGMSTMIIRLQPGQPVNKALAAMGPIFKKYNPDSPFTYDFLDDGYSRKFESERRVGDLAAVFTTLAIFISCLGLFGLASFVAEQRTKEIGVRKVLGAGVFTLWNLLSKDFLRLVCLSFFIAMPMSYLLMNKWLQTYNYRTTASWWIFAAAGGGILLITIATVSFQALKAATMNPTKSLRSE